MNTIDCIIPFYNEDAIHIKYIINLLLGASWIGRVICVDDGSTNDGFFVLKRTLSNSKRVILVRCELNCGKSHALCVGLTHVTSKAVLTLDADMSSISLHEFTRAKDVFYTKHYDLLILQLVNEPKQAKNFKGDILLSGQRIIKSLLLKEICTEKKPTGYAIEVVTNTYVMDHNLTYGSISCSAHNIQPIDKLGVWRGIKKELGQLYDIVSSLGVIGFVDMYSNFSKRLKRE